MLFRSQVPELALLISLSNTVSSMTLYLCANPLIPSPSISPSLSLSLPLYLHYILFLYPPFLSINPPSSISPALSIIPHLYFLSPFLTISCPQAMLLLPQHSPLLLISTPIRKSRCSRGTAATGNGSYPSIRDHIRSILYRSHQLTAFQAE